MIRRTPEVSLALRNDESSSGVCRYNEPSLVAWIDEEIHQTDGSGADYHSISAHVTNTFTV